MAGWYKYHITAGVSIYNVLADGYIYLRLDTCTAYLLMCTYMNCWIHLPDNGGLVQIPDNGWCEHIQCTC